MNKLMRKMESSYSWILINKCRQDNSIWDTVQQSNGYKKNISE